MATNAAEAAPAFFLVNPDMVTFLSCEGFVRRPAVAGIVVLARVG